MLKIQSYITIVGHSLLSLIDNTKTKNNVFNLKLTKDEQEFLRYQICSNIKNNIHYGYKNILIRSCKPQLNWRQQERGKKIKNFSILIDDNHIDLIKIDIQKFEYFLNSFWNNKLSKLIPNIAIIDEINMDTTDLLKCINEFFPKSGYINEYYYNILSDGNSKYSHEMKIPDFMKFSIEQQLRGHTLIN